MYPLSVHDTEVQDRRVSSLNRNLLSFVDGVAPFILSSFIKTIFTPFLLHSAATADMINERKKRPIPQRVGAKYAFVFNEIIIFKLTSQCSYRHFK